MLKKGKCCMESKAPLYAGRCVYACIYVRDLLVSVCVWLCLGSQHRNSLGVHEKGSVQRIKKHWFPETYFIASGKSHNATTCFFYGLHNRVTSAGFILEATINSRSNNNLAALGATPVLAAPLVQTTFFTGHLWASVAAWRRLCLTLLSLVRKCLSSASCTYSEGNLLPPEGRH